MKKPAYEHNMNSLKKSGDELYQLMETLFPICRSITGNELVVGEFVKDCLGHYEALP